jgi:hypothetical protein
MVLKLSDVVIRRTNTAYIATQARARELTSTATVFLLFFTYFHADSFEFIILSLPL